MISPFLPPAGQMVTIYDYGDGLVEGTWMSMREGSLRPKEKAERGESENREENEIFACRRAKTKARRLILTLRPSSLGTTTFRDNVADPKTAWRVMDRFIRFVHKRYPSDKFIAFPELQERGAFHFHFPITGWMPKEKLKYYHDCWRKASGKHGGTFNVRWRRAPGVSNAENTVKICNYLTKYLSKQIGKTPRELGAHRYRASKDITPKRVRYLMDEDTLQRCSEELAELIFCNHNGLVEYYFQSSLDSPVPVFGWACTWGGRRRHGKSPPS
ncbi:MAG: hypothetical protein WAO76_12470 [Georgfuchsia sp.]